MPMIVAALLGGLIEIAGSMVGRVLLSLGMSFVTYGGIKIMLDSLGGLVKSRLSGLPADVVGMLGLLQVDTCVSIILSALAVRLTMSGLSADGKITKMVTKK